MTRENAKGWGGKPPKGSLPETTRKLRKKTKARGLPTSFSSLGCFCLGSQLARGKKVGVISRAALGIGSGRTKGSSKNLTLWSIPHGRRAKNRIFTRTSTFYRERIIWQIKPGNKGNEVGTVGTKFAQSYVLGSSLPATRHRELPTWGSGNARGRWVSDSPISVTDRHGHPAVFRIGMGIPDFRRIRVFD